MGNSTYAAPDYPEADDLAGWQSYWRSHRQPWRRKPIILPNRQEILRDRLTFTGLVQSDFAFRGFALQREDVEWLLAYPWNQQSFPHETEWASLPALDLRGADLRNVDLSGMPLLNLRGGVDSDELASMSERDCIEAGLLLDYASLSGARLDHAVLNYASLVGAKLAETHLDDAHLIHASLKQAEISRSWFPRANFSGADLSNVKMKGAQLPDVDLRAAKMSCARFTDTEFSRADMADIVADEAIFIRCTLSHAIVRRGDLRRAKLMRADLEESDLFRANLTDADCHATTFYRCDLRHAQLRNAILTYSQLSQSNCEHADFEGADLHHAHLEGAILVEALLNRADLHNTFLEGSDLSRALLVEADLRYAHLEQATLAYVNADRALLQNALLNGANLRDATCTGVDLSETSLGGRVMPDKRLADLRAILGRFPAIIPPAQLTGAKFDKRTRLNGMSLGDPRRGYAFVGNIRWDQCDLGTVEWKNVKAIGEEEAAYALKRLMKRHPDKGSPRTRLQRQNALRDKYREACQAYRQLSRALHNQGLLDEAELYHYRAQLLQRQLYRISGARAQYTLSLLLDVVTGYGYRLHRAVLTYLFVVLGFACMFFALSSRLSTHPLTIVQSLFLSVANFHGLGFWGSLPDGIPFSITAAIESIIGLLIEICVIIAVTKWYLSE